MDKDLGQAGCTPGPDLAPNPLSKVDNARPDGEPPAEVPKTVFRGVEGERGDVVGVSRVTDEASGGMGVETDHEEERKVVRVPEGLEALVADLVVCGGVHEKHDQEHEVTSDTTSLVVVNVNSQLRSDLCVRNGCQWLC